MYKTVRLKCVKNPFTGILPTHKAKSFRWLVSSGPSFQPIAKITPAPQQEALDAELLESLSDLFANHRDKCAMLLLRNSIKTRNSHWAQYYLGHCYLHGIGTQQNETQAAKVFRKAAARENIKAQTALGLCYFYGQGVKRSLKKAEYWLKKAAEQEDIDAGSMLYALWINGHKKPSSSSQPTPPVTKQTEAKTIVSTLESHNEDNALKNANNKPSSSEKHDAQKNADSRPSPASSTTSSSFFTALNNVAGKRSPTVKDLTQFIPQKSDRLKICDSSTTLVRDQFF
jgi:hypothetical protein